MNNFTEVRIAEQSTEMHMIVRLEFRSEMPTLIKGVKLRNEQKLIKFVYTSLLKFDHRTTAT